MIRMRIFQIIFFFPCCIRDGIGLFLINVPMWILTGTPVASKEPYIEWLMDLKNK